MAENKYPSNDNDDIDAFIKATLDEHDNEREFARKMLEHDLPSLKIAAKMLLDVGIDVDLERYIKTNYIPDESDFVAEYYEDDYEVDAGLVLISLANFINDERFVSDKEKIELAVGLLGTVDIVTSIPNLRDKIRTILATFFNGGLPLEVIDDDIVDAASQAQRLLETETSKYTLARLMSYRLLSDELEKRLGKHDGNATLASKISDVIHYNRLSQNIQDLTGELTQKRLGNIAKLYLDPLYQSYKNQAELVEIIEAAEDKYDEYLNR